MFSMLRRQSTFLVAGVVLSLLIACGSSDPTPVAAPLATQVDPAPTVAPTAPPAPEPTQTPTPVVPAPTATAVSPDPTATPVPEPTPNPWVIDAIVDPENFGWPRAVRSGDGIVEIAAPPERVHTLSLGHDEIIVAIAGADRMVGIGSLTANETNSKLAAEVADLPKIKRDPEQVVSLDPDIVIASKFTKQDLVDSIAGTGITVVRTVLETSVGGHEANIRMVAYILGEEGSAEALITEVRERIAFVAELTEDVSPADRPVVLSIARFSDSISAAGADTTEGGIILQANGVNAAAEAGLEGHNTISAESIISMKPDVIVITQPDPGASALKDDLLGNPVLASVPAVVNGMVLLGDAKYFTTLSHWNVRGIEELATELYPDLFADVTFTDF